MVTCSTYYSCLQTQHDDNLQSRKYVAKLLAPITMTTGDHLYFLGHSSQFCLLGYDVTYFKVTASNWKLSYFIAKITRKTCILFITISWANINTVQDILMPVSCFTFDFIILFPNLAGQTSSMCYGRFWSSFMSWRTVCALNLWLFWMNNTQITL